MINGNHSDNFLQQDFVKRQEFAPVVEKVEYLLIERGKTDIMLENMAENISKMAKSNEAVAKNSEELNRLVGSLVMHDKIRTFIIKVTVWTMSGVIGLTAAHLTGIIKLIAKLGG